MKKIDAVKMMRDIRDKLSAQYKSSPEKQNEDLKAVRKKHRLGETIKK